MSISAQRLSTFLTQAGLVRGDEMSAILETLPAERREDLPTVLETLVARGKLTPYQAERLAAGREAELLRGDYLILDRIGAGGMGQVFRALHRRMKRITALKQLPPEMLDSPEAVLRFQREVEAAAKLSHPHIVAALDAREENGVHYLVMEYVPGRDLSQIVARNGPLALPVALSCIRQTAEGLDHAHRHGIVHRDIKPANLLLDREGQIKILDMGLARFDSGGDESSLTGIGDVMGTADYMSPEQSYDTHYADARSDLYSLGCTLYFLLTGERMFGGATIVQRILAHRELPPPQLSARRADLPADVEDLYQKLVAKRPSDRWQTAREVMEAVDRLLPTSSGGAAESESSVRLLSQFVAARPAVLGELAVTAPLETAVLPARETQKITAPPRPAGSRFALLATIAAILVLAALVAGAWFARPKVAQTPPPVAEIPSTVAPPVIPADISGHALSFDGKTSRVQVSDWNYDGSTPLTLEAWVLMRSLPAAQTVAIISNIEEKGTALKLIDSRPSLAAVGQDGYSVAAGDWFTPLHRWTHLAGVIEGKQVTLFVNGAKQRSPATLQLPFRPSREPFLIGAGPKLNSDDRYEQFLDGLIDEVRISTTARYSDNFNPERRFENDEHTAVLYHMDEAEGNVARDASGHGRDGAITAAEWIALNDPLAAETPPLAPRGPPPAFADAPFDAEQARAHQEAWSEYLGTPVEFTDDLGMEFVLIPPGRFWLGAAPIRLDLDEKGKLTDVWKIGGAGSRPRRVRTISRPFYFGKTEVTVEQYRKFVERSDYQTELEHSGTGGWIWSGKEAKHLRDASHVWSHPTIAGDPKMPAVLLSFADGGALAAWQSRHERTTYRFATDAEWEHACRAGTTTRFFFGEDAVRAAEYGWTKESSLGRKHPVGRKKPNPFGIYDLYGNGLEWCAEAFDAKSHHQSSLVDPYSVQAGNARVVRGGFHDSPAAFCTSAQRHGLWEQHDYPDQAIRLVREIPWPPDFPAAEPIDLLALADPELARGTWKKDGGELTTSGSRRACALPIPYAPPEEYFLELEVTPESDQSVIGIGAVIFGEQGSAEFNSRDKTARIDNATTAPVTPLPAGRRRRLRLEVREAEMALYLEGVKVTSLAKPRGRIVRPWDLGLDNDECLFLYSVNAIRIHRATLTPLAGRGRMLRLERPKNDRELVLWLARQGCSGLGYSAATGQKQYTTERDIPPGPFAVTSVRLDGKQRRADDGLSFVADWKAVNFVELWSSGVTDLGVERLSSMPNVSHVLLNGTPITDRACDSLQRLPRLTSLAAEYTAITDQGLLALVDYPRLEKLELSGCKITDTGLAALAKCERLTLLVVGETPISAVGLRELKGHPKLKRLGLARCAKLDDEAYRVLTEFTQLETLDLRSNTISDAAAGELAKIKTLKKLDLTAAKISEQAVATLQTALPMCEIKLSK